MEPLEPTIFEISLQEESKNQPLPVEGVLGLSNSLNQSGSVFLL